MLKPPDANTYSGDVYFVRTRVFGRVRTFKFTKVRLESGRYSWQRETVRLESIKR